MTIFITTIPHMHRESISGNAVVDVAGNVPGRSWRGQRASQGGIEGEILVGWIMRVLEVLNLLSFLYLCILFILCRLTPLVNPLPFCHFVSTPCSTSFTWGYALA